MRARLVLTLAAVRDPQDHEFGVLPRERPAGVPGLIRGPLIAPP